MDDSQSIELLNEIIQRLGKAGWKERDPIKEELLQLLQRSERATALLETLDNLRRELTLEVRWEVDEVIEALRPAEPEVVDEEEEEEEPVDEKQEDPNQQLSMSDLVMVYDDPRGLVLYRAKVGERWFAAQPDPMTGRPRMFELRNEEITQLKQQLAGSPYWMMGTGANSEL